MRTILICICMSLLFAACTDSGKPIGVGVTTSEPPASTQKPNSEQQGKAFSISTPAYYEGRIETPAPGQLVSLNMTPEGMAKLIMQDQTNAAKTYMDGSWVTKNNGNLMLNVRATGSKDSTLLEFKTDGEKLVYTGTVYGPGGLTLVSKPLPQ